ncbi:hypothetical protein FS837_002225, partial [Tulasnella sp. UAMH 9824]
WAFLEQLTAAALDLGRDDIAEECIGQLNERFPDSPRVQILFGMRREASGDLTGALKLYDAILEVDEAHAGIWKRRVAVYRQLGDTKRAAEDLCRYLDTFYTDVEGWLELADLYRSSLQALSHAMLLAPQNPFYVLQFAETAATSGQWGLALKMFLRVVEMAELPVDEQDQNGDGNGLVRRAYVGVKLSTRKLQTEAVTASVPSNDGGSSKKIATGPTEEADAKVPSEETLRQLDALATERIGALSGSVGKTSGTSPSGYGVMMKWLSA